MHARRRVETRTAAGVATVAMALVALLGAAVPAAAQDVPELPDPEDLTDPAEVAFFAVAVLDALLPDEVPDPLDQLDPLNPSCDQLDPGHCLFPFPSNFWTTPADTDTGLRVDLPVTAMPRNVYGKPIDPTEWNRNDGFSPGSPLTTFLPEVDLARTWGIHDRPERYRDQVTDLALSLADDAPIVVVDADTGERHPFYSELDGHEDTPDGRRTLIVRPAVNFLEGHRYVIGMRDLVGADGSSIAPSDVFRQLRDGTHGGDRQAHYDAEVFPVLEAAGVERGELVTAWDLTIASQDNLAGRLLHMRDESFAALGDTDLADGVVEGSSPGFAITEVTEVTDPDADTARTVRGTVTVPNYLTLPGEAAVPVPELGDVPVPGQRLYYGIDALTAGPGTLPQVNPLAPTRDVDFVCHVPRSAVDGAPAVPTLYGHGLLGSKEESGGSSTERIREAGHMPCAVDWTGMATGDVPNVALILQDLSLFPSLVDRELQGFLEFLVLGRALSHPEGLAADPAFQDADGRPLFDHTALVYDGNSQGGILGGALVAVAPDLTRAVLGVPGINYSTLLNRSVDWEGAYGDLLYLFYPDKVEQQAAFTLINMLWDRGEGNGYAQHMTVDPLPNTPPHQVLLHVAFGDHQVANLAAEVQGRTIGARRMPGDLPDCRHWALDQYVGFEVNDPTVRHPAVLAYYDSGTPTPPNDNSPPAGLGDDPHGDPRKDPRALVQKTTFWETGTVPDVFDGQHARTHEWPNRAGDHLPEVQAQLAGDCLAAAGAEPPAPAPDPDAPAAPDPDPGLAAPDPDPGPAAPAPAPLPTTGGGLAVVVAGLALLGARRTRT